MIKVIFFGTDDISVPTLQALIKSPKYDVVGVVTKPDSARGRGHKIESPEAALIAREHQIKLFQPTKLKEIIPDIAALHADVGALVSYGRIIPQALIDIFPHGIVNFHPSMLPVYRGPSPIETAIMNGDRFTGLTLMSVEKDMDAGPVYYQERVAIGSDDTASELRQRFGQRGAELFIDKLDQIASGVIEGLPQDDELAIYCHMITKADGMLDPATMTARECYNRWRALASWPKCRINFGGQQVILAEAKPLDNFAGDDWPDVIPCANGSALQIIKVVSPKSGKTMKASDYLRGLHLD